MWRIESAKQRIIKKERRGEERRPVYSNRKELEVQPTKPRRFAASSPPHSPFLSHSCLSGVEFQFVWDKKR